MKQEKTHILRESGWKMCKFEEKYHLEILEA